MYKKQLIYEVLQCAKQIDPNAFLMPWDNDSGQKNLNGNEIRLMSDKVITEYSTMPSIDGEYKEGIIYYGNRVRIGTKVEINKFVDRWNFKNMKKLKRHHLKNRKQ